jgi:hypothetical protein
MLLIVQTLNQTVPPQLNSTYYAELQVWPEIGQKMDIYKTNRMYLCLDRYQFNLCTIKMQWNDIR